MAENYNARSRIFISESWTFGREHACTCTQTVNVSWLNKVKQLENLMLNKTQSYTFDPT